MNMQNSESRKRNAPTAPEVGLREAVEAIVNSPEADMFRAAAFEHRVPQPYADNRYLCLLDAVRQALATHPSPPLPGQPGVAEVKDLAEAWERGAFAGREYQKSLSRWDRVVSPPEHAPNPHAGRAAEVARTLGGAS